MTKRRIIVDADKGRCLVALEEITNCHNGAIVTYSPCAVFPKGYKQTAIMAARAVAKVYKARISYEWRRER